MTTEMTKVLNSNQRRFLDAQTQRARTAAQRAANDALRALAVAEPSRPGYLSDEQNRLRLALRDKARQLGDDTARAGAQLTNLVHDVAYEQWHRLLFARFLEVNGLLRHPEYRDIPLSLEDCGDFAPDLGEPDAWAVAARFASEILPGVFRLTDPAVQVRFAAEHRDALERLLLEIPAEVFTTEDALGWVYQFWQTAEKKRVNDSGVKIGGADLSPVTQLFTENYMVRFLLENSLGAWWAARHPKSPMVDTWEYLRRNEDGTPAAGSFSDWPEHAADVTVMDPCCGSGHFLVAMFGMLWRMRAEEEGLTPAEAQDAVLRDNLHGLELDPRCTQIATFNVAMEAWKQGGFRTLPAPAIGCSGIPVSGLRSEWEALSCGDKEVAKPLGYLHDLFQKAPTLGSLIDPRSFLREGDIFGRNLAAGVAWERMSVLLADALQAETSRGSVLGHAADDAAHAANLLSRQYTLVVTNPPYLARGRQDAELAAYLDDHYPRSKADLATAFAERMRAATEPGGTYMFVAPQNALFLSRYRAFRAELLTNQTLQLVAILGERAFASPAAAGAFVALYVISNRTPPTGNNVVLLDSAEQYGILEKIDGLKHGELHPRQTTRLLSGPDSRIVLQADAAESLPLLDTYAYSYAGIQTGDSLRFIRRFWELPKVGHGWEFQQSTVTVTTPYGGRSSILKWDNGHGALYDFVREKLGAGGVGAWLRGIEARGKRGVVVSAMRDLPATIYGGHLFDNNCAVIVPSDPELTEALWAYIQSGEFTANVRQIDRKVNVTNATLVKIPFDKQRWIEAAAALPPPTSTDPSQWIFDGNISKAAEPLQVAVARLLGFRWPDQQPHESDHLVDADGIASLPSLPGEPDLATRLREFLLSAYGGAWSSKLEHTLVRNTGFKSGRLEDWLRDSFFAQHMKVFKNRPFLWHIWDGRKDGFSAIVNYHKLDHRTLEKLTFTSLGAWIDRQKHEARAERAGADARLASAEDLQRRLKLILEGAPPYDIYVRWKPMAEQAIGWEPDLDDGVRLNIRPFVKAGVLRVKLDSMIKWGKDRGTNPDGSERHNDLHPALEKRRAARRETGAAG